MIRLKAIKVLADFRADHEERSNNDIRMNFFAPAKAEENPVLLKIGGVLRILIGGDCPNEDGHVLGAYDLHLGTGEDHLIGGKRLGAPELTLDPDKTLR